MPFPIHSKKTVIYTSKKVASASVRKLVQGLDFPDADFDTWKISGEGRDMKTPPFKPEYEEYHKIAIIRDPIDRVNSCFRHRVENTKTLLRNIAPSEAQAKRRLAAEGLDLYPTFTYFVENSAGYCKLNNNLARHLDSQEIALGPLDWYDEVYKVDDLSVLGGKMGLPMPHLHKTSGRGLKDDEVRAAYEMTKAEYAYLRDYFPIPEEVTRSPAT